MDFSQNNLEELKSVVLQKKHIAAFIGAGCSSVLNIPIWNELLFELNKQFGPYNSKEELQEAIKTSDYPLVASKIESKVTDKKLYFDILKKLTQPRTCFFTSLHLELVHLTKTIVTTNYDRSFEETLDCLSRMNKSHDFNYTSSSIGKFSHIGLGMIRNIYHIHGDNKEGRFILTYDSYKEQYEDLGSGVAHLIQTIFTDFHVVFVGFSFNDNFFVNFLEDRILRIKEELSKYGKGSLPTHYCIVSDTLFKDYLNPSELTDKEINITELVEGGIIRSESFGAVKEPILYFTANAGEVITKSHLKDNSKTYLLNQLELFSTNLKKVELFNLLNIKPITFEGNNFLQIESILREINAAYNPFADTYIPNSIGR